SVVSSDGTCSRTISCLCPVTFGGALWQETSGCKTRGDAGRLLPGIHINLALVTMAGFQVTLYGRFWVTPKAHLSYY
ncbi:MAG TPA: hypothetical protein VI320_30905, partial [Terracidiphilus sp.]